MPHKESPRTTYDVSRVQRKASVDAEASFVYKYMYNANVVHILTKKSFGPNRV